MKPVVEEPENPVELKEIKGRIEFKHVWFAYDGEDYILKDVSFTIEPGQRVAFVGATGAGKSSILNLIGRYYDIQKGEILLDGVDIRKLKKSSCAPPSARSSRTCSCLPEIFPAISGCATRRSATRP